MSGDSVTGLQQNPAGAGYFGKVPVRGDFLSFGLPRDFVDPWDDWIQLALANSHTQLEDGWLEVYLTSPVWHFALAPAICGDKSWAGVFMPSVDAVGRYFPLTIAAPMDSAANVTTVLAASQAWFLEVEQLARSSLEGGFDLAAFDRSIQSLKGPDGEPGQGGLNADDGSGDRLSNAWRYDLASPSLLTNECPALLRELMDKLFFAWSLWWTAGSARVSPTLLVCQGLPPPQGYAAMLDGNWQQWGWEDRHVFPIAPSMGAE